MHLRKKNWPAAAVFALGTIAVANSGRGPVRGGLPSCQSDASLTPVRPDGGGAIESLVRLVPGPTYAFRPGECAAAADPTRYELFPETFAVLHALVLGVGIAVAGLVWATDWNIAGVVRRSVGLQGALVAGGIAIVFDTTARVRVECFGECVPLGRSLSAALADAHWAVFVPALLVGLARVARRGVRRYRAHVREGDGATE